MADAPLELSSLIAACGVARGARVLRLGTVSAGAEKRVRLLIDTLGASTIDVAGDIFNAPLPKHIDLAVVAPPVAATADTFEELLYGSVAPALTDGGLAVVQFLRDASDAAFGAMNVASTARETLRNFLVANFGAHKLDSLVPIENRFAGDGTFAAVGWAARTRATPLDEPLVWLVLRKREHGQPSRAIARSRRPDRYATAELGPFARALRNEGIAFVDAATFVERVQARASKGAGLVKLDIHRNIRRPPEVARALAKAAVPALFLMMHRHPFNDAFFDAAETWDILNAIQDGGHEIGLHLDPVHLIRTFGDVYVGLEAAMAGFAKRGFTIRAATLHGDTSAHISARGMKAWDFFAEDKPRANWNGVPPEGEAFLADHIGRYSYAELAARFGIEHMVEAHYHYRGQTIAPGAFVYMTDNARSLQVTNIPGAEGTTRIGVPEPFRIPATFAMEVAPILRAHPFLALFHPQWFW